MHNETRKSIEELQSAVNALGGAFEAFNRDRENNPQFIDLAGSVGAVEGCMRALQTAIAIYDPPEPLYANEKMQDAAIRRMDEGQ